MCEQDKEYDSQILQSHLVNGDEFDRARESELVVVKFGAAGSGSRKKKVYGECKCSCIQN